MENAGAAVDIIVKVRAICQDTVECYGPLTSKISLPLHYEHCYDTCRECHGHAHHATTISPSNQLQSSALSPLTLMSDSPHMPTGVFH